MTVLSKVNPHSDAAGSFEKLPSFKKPIENLRRNVNYAMRAIRPVRRYLTKINCFSQRIFTKVL